MHEYYVDDIASVTKCQKRSERWERNRPSSFSQSHNVKTASRLCLQSRHRKQSKHPETGSSRSPKGKRKRKGNEKQHNDLEDEDDRPKESKLVKIDSWEDSDVVEYTDNKPEEVSEQTLS
jgi:hypothetical protein